MSDEAKQVPVSQIVAAANEKCLNGYKSIGAMVAAFDDLSAVIKGLVGERSRLLSRIEELEKQVAPDA